MKHREKRFDLTLITLAIDAANDLSVFMTRRHLEKHGFFARWRKEWSERAR